MHTSRVTIKRVLVFITLVVPLSLAFAFGCGGSSDSDSESSTPSIESLTDSNDNAISADETQNTTRLSGLATNTYTVNFNTFMDADTVTDSNITFSCDESSQEIASITATSSENRSFTITPTNRLPQYTNCTMTFGSGITSLAEVELGETSFTWPTTCASSDEFENSETLAGCWSQENTFNAAVIDIDETTADSMTFTYTDFRSDAETGPFVYKTVTGDFDVSTFISDCNYDENTEASGMVVTLSPDVHPENVAFIGLMYDGSAQIGYTVTEAGSVTRNYIAYAFSLAYLRINRNDDVFNLYVSTDGDEWTLAYSFDGSFLGETVSLGFSGQTLNTNGDLVTTYDYLRFLEGQAVDQDS